MDYLKKNEGNVDSKTLFNLKEPIKDQLPPIQENLNKMSKLNLMGA